MNSMEKSMLLDELFALCKADKEERDRLLEKLDRMTEQLMNLNESSQRLLKQNEEKQKIILDLNELVEKLQKENAALKEQKKQDRKNLYGSKSQKISRKKKEEAPSHEENKDDFDGLQDLHPSPQVTKILFHKHRRKRKGPIVRGCLTGV